MVAPRCSFIRAGGQRCRSYALRGNAFCYHHDPGVEAQRKREERNAAGAATTNASTAHPDQHLSEDEVTVPDSRAAVRQLLTRSIRDVLTGRITPQRGKVVQDLARQVLPLLPAEDDAAKDKSKGDLTDEELLIELLREAEILRARISARGGNGSAAAKPNGKAPVSYAGEASSILAAATEED